MNPESDDELLSTFLTEIQAELKKEALTGSLEFEFPLEVAETSNPWANLRGLASINLWGPKQSIDSFLT
jgi:hypothetical protein